MANQPLLGVLQNLRKVAAVHTDRELSDRELLDRFLTARDESAFTVLIERHGPMVLGVCRRSLPNLHDAEDACQATFLVLARKAASVRKKSSLGSWLHGVACRVAANLKRDQVRRKAREREVGAKAPMDPAAEVTWREVQTILDEELQRLPERYRTPMILCYLECMTRDEAAQQLGLSPTTLHGRLEHARGLLRDHLKKRGLTLPAVMSAAVLGESLAQAALTPTLVVSSTKAAVLLATGQTVTEGVVTNQVLALTQEVIKNMFLTKLKLASAALLCAGLMVAVIGGTLDSLAAQDGSRTKTPAVEERTKAPQIQKPKEENEAFTAWGKEVGGLQAGLGFRPGKKRAYHHGEAVGVVLRVRNVGKEAVDFNHIWAFFAANPPIITGADGKAIQLLPGYRALGRQAPRSANVAPGKEVELYEWSFDLRPQGESGNKGSLTIHGSGKFSLQCERIVGPTMANPNHPNPAMSKLATGKLELEVKDEVPPGKTDRPAGSRASGASPDSKAAYPTADIVVQYRDESGREVRDLQQFRVEDTETVAELASHFPGILGDRGSGPRTTAGKRATFTIKFNHKSGDVSGVRVAHISADYTTWWWRDNPPYTGDREVEGKDQLKSLMEGLAAKNKVDLK
jgi:RNA polymerase sigma factor (sigma-70 family)